MSQCSVEVTKVAHLGHMKVTKVVSRGNRGAEVAGDHGLSISITGHLLPVSPLSVNSTLTVIEPEIQD